MEGKVKKENEEEKIKEDNEPQNGNGFSFPAGFEEEFTKINSTQSTPEFGSFNFNFDQAESSEFNFSFADFSNESNVNEGASFTFDINETENKPEEDKLFDQFISLISNPCFEYKGKPLNDIFKQEDPTDSASAAFAYLTGNI